MNHLGKQTGLRNYGKNVNQAIRSYASTARPRYMRDRAFISPLAGGGASVYKEGENNYGAGGEYY